MSAHKRIPLFDLIMSLTNTIDLVSPVLVNHHKQVAYISYCLADELGMSKQEKNDLLLAGALHDIGGLSLQDRMDALTFEAINPYLHAELGYKLLEMFPPFKRIAPLVRYHHVPWGQGTGTKFKGREVSFAGHIIHLADRIAVLINKRQEILSQVDSISARIEGKSGKMFHPQLVDAYKNLATKECFWLDTVSNSIVPSLNNDLDLDKFTISLHDLLGLAKLFSRIIDFRSPFTANHSSGVAASAEALARFNGFGSEECLMMKVAGFLHDLGKLAIPAEIIHKSGKLTQEEFNIIRGHTFYTYRALLPIKELDTINRWASFHHERLDGSGYPFHLKAEELPLGSRIMAVADVFTAITEDRPYRLGMDNEKALKILKKMVNSDALDAEIVKVLEENYAEINQIRITAQQATAEEYKYFID